MKCMTASAAGLVFEARISPTSPSARRIDVSRYQTLSYEERDGVAWVILNRPEVHNAFDHRMMRELHECWRGLRDNDDVRAVVLTGAGDKAFCTGLDRTAAAV